MNEVGLRSRKQLNSIINRGVSIIDFNASWCRPCVTQERIIHELKKRFQGRVVILAVDVDESRPLAIKLGIQSIPTTIVFKDGHEVRRFIGLQSARTLETALEKILGNTD